MKFVLCLLLTFFSCTSNRTKKEVKPPKAELAPALRSPYQITSMPGQVTYFSFPQGDYPEGEMLTCGIYSYPVYFKSGTGHVYLGESYFAKKRSYKCTYVSEKNVIAVIEVVDFPYKSERLHVDKKRVFLKEKDQQRVNAEQVVLNKIYNNSPREYLFTTPFRMPLRSKITSAFGTRRVFNNKKQTQHLGTDLRAAVGVRIPAANDGKVVIARNLFYTGNVVYLDHGMGIFTNYGHMSKILVSEGDIVRKGDILGLAGATGRVTGRHLHWGVKINGQWIDGKSLVQSSIKHLGKR